MSRSSCEPVRGASDAAPSHGQEPCQQRGEKRRHKPKHHQSRLLNSTYQLGEELGRGSSGKVYRALNRETGDFRAIKEIPTQNMLVGHLEAVQSEIDLLHNLQHPQIVRYFETIRTEDHLYLVLEYVENGSLSSIVKNFGRFPEHLVVAYVRQVLTGLVWLHEHGVCHRDIKGANLLVTKDGQVKLADFGVARKLSDVAQSASVVGTPYWMAPEIIQMSAFTTASDIWSLGCTIIELINGEPPHYDLAPISALYRIVQDPRPPFPKDISPLLVDFLSRCFTRDPDKRATAAQLRKHDWLRVEPGSFSNSGGNKSAAAQRIAQLAVRQLQTVSTLNPGGPAVGNSHNAHEDDWHTHDSANSAHGEVNLRSVGGASDSYTQLSMGSKGYSHSIGSKGHSHSVGSKGHSQNNSNLCSNNHSGSQLSGNHSVNSHGHDFRQTHSMPQGAHGHFSPPTSQNIHSSHAVSAGRRRDDNQQRSISRDVRDGASREGKVKPPPPGSPPRGGHYQRHLGEPVLSEGNQPSSSRDRRPSVGSSSARQRGRDSPSRSAQLGRVEGAQSSRSSSFSVGSVAERKPSINNQASLPQMPAYRGNLVELHGKELRGAIESSPSRQRTGAALHSPQRRPAEGLGHSGADREVSSDSASSLSHSHTYLSVPLHASSPHSLASCSLPLHLPPHPPSQHPSFPLHHQLPSAHLTQSPLLGGDKARLAAPAPAADGSGDARRLQDEVVRLNKSMAQTGANGLQPQCMGTAFDHDVFGRSSPKPYKICLPGSDGYANGGGDAPLSGYLWKRGSGWRSLTYQRRFVYLANDCLCYRAKAPTVEQGVLDGSSDKRIDLASVLNVRVHSKLKFEFELVCISRSFRLRAPSAQALAVWVTTISAEWMQLQHRSTQKAVSEHQIPVDESSSFLS